MPAFIPGARAFWAAPLELREIVGVKYTMQLTTPKSQCMILSTPQVWQWQMMRLAFEGLDDPWMPPPFNLLEDGYFLLSRLMFSACAKAADDCLAWGLRNKVAAGDSDAAGGRDTVTKVWGWGEGVFVMGRVSECGRDR
jgi:hypothetical protein